MTKSIDREVIKRKMDQGEDFVIIEVLGPKTYREKHIKGAINIPLEHIGHEALKLYEKDKEIIVYCADTDCQASPKAAKKLENLGFTNVYDYEEGKADWEEASYPMESGE